MSLVVGTNSWVSLSEANTYFTTRIGTAGWDNLTTDAEKNSYLITAYNWIKYDPTFNVPADSTEEDVKKGQCEAALFLINHYEDYQRREAQIASGITKFNYSEWHEYLSESTKPRSIINFFASAGFYNGGVASTLLHDNSTIT